jgi:G:T/U-mismatch repair DNA glycosylase
MTPSHDPPMTPQVQQAGEAEVRMRYEEKMAQELRALERTHRQSIDDAMAEAQRERSELRETLEAAHALELEGLLAQQTEVRKALELKHSAAP